MSFDREVQEMTNGVHVLICLLHPTL